MKSVTSTSGNFWMSAFNVWSIIKIMTGPNNFIDKNPENEENQFKNLSHDKSEVTITSCRLIFDLIGDLSSEFRTGLWWYPDDNLQFKEKFNKQGIPSHEWIQRCRFSSETQIYVCVLGTARQGSWGSMLGFHCVFRFPGLCSCSANFQLALNTVRGVSARI